MSFENDKLEQVSKHGIPGERNSAGIGHIIIPKDISRNKYVNNCFEQGTVSFITDNSEKVDNVKVSKHIWNELEFPTTPTKLGSSVVWVNVPKYNQPLIVGIIPKNDENIPHEEFEFQHKRYLEGFGLVEIIGNAKEQNLILQVNSSRNDIGELNVKVRNKSKNAKINLEVDGDFNINASKKIELNCRTEFKLNIKGNKEDNTFIEYSKGEGFRYLDEFGNEIIIDSEGSFKIKAKKIKLGEGSEPLILGNIFKDLLDDLIETISKATVTTVLGQMPLINAAEILKLKERTKDILSELSFTN